jgi:hypothetical protein
MFPSRRRVNAQTMPAYRKLGASTADQPASRSRAPVLLDG